MINPDKEIVIQAIKDSIEKWKVLATGVLNRYSCYNCPLCILFNTQEYIVVPDCTLCPIKLKTNVDNCKRSPYYDYADFRIDLKYESKSEYSLLDEKDITLLKELAQKEVDFLQEVLIEYESGKLGN